MLYEKQIKLDGNIFGVALNYKCLYQKFRAVFNEKPYITEPVKPVLFIKTPNTRNHDGAIVYIPHGEILQAGPTLGVVIGKNTSRVSLKEAGEHIAGYVVVNELSLPEENYYRPAIKAKCRDGSCVLGSVVAKEEIKNINALALRVYVNNQLVQHGTTANWIRTPEQLIQEISEYMTLNEGDVLLTGTPLGRADLHDGDTVTVEIENIGKVTNIVLQQGAIT